MGVGLDVVEPCGFPLSDRSLKRAALDYAQGAEVARHDSWSAYRAAQPGGRLVLFTTRGAARLDDFVFRPDDRLLFGRESAGAPDEVHDQADARVFIPIRPQTRSLNVVTAAAMALCEAMRQTQGFPGRPESSPAP